MDIQEKLNEGAAKVVPLSMDEFMTYGNDSSTLPLKVEEGASTSDFPDLLDSGNSLASLNPTYSYNPTDPSLENFLKPSNLKNESDGGFVLTNLNEMNNDYPDVDVSNLTPPVVAKKSVVQLTDIKSELEFQVKNEIAPPSLPPPSLEPTESVFIKSEIDIKDEPAVKVETPAQQFKTTLTFYNAMGNPLAKGGSGVLGSAPVTAPIVANSSATTTITLGGGGAGVAAPPSAILPPSTMLTGPSAKQETIDLTSDDEDSFGTSFGNAPKSATPPSKIVPILSPPRDPNDKDPTKETYTHTKSDGCKIEIPSIITNGYDFENMRCLLCEKPPFKNEKTLINHLLNHFGVTPKMAKCPVCGLSLQKKSFARHARLHGDYIPEYCPYCRKEFREKRSLDKHIKAIHEAERPYNCDRCPETFRNQVELRAHITRHEKDHPFVCELCSMSFQKQEALTIHLRTHTGERPFGCNVCDKTFTNEKSLKTHVLRHEGNLPYKCDLCEMTFPSNAHLEKHASSHSRKTQVTVAKINTFLESFGASLGEFGLADDYNSSDQISLHPATESGEIKDQSVKLQMEGRSSSVSASFTDVNESVAEDFEDNSALDPLVVGLTEEDAEIAAKKELSVEIAISVDGSYTCKLCNTVIRERKTYLSHLRRHAKTFSSKTHLIRHSRDGQTSAMPVQFSPSVSSSGGEGTSLACNMCGKLFGDKASLQEHTKMHLIEDAKAKFRKDRKVKFLLFSCSRVQSFYIYIFHSHFQRDFMVNIIKVY